MAIMKTHHHPHYHTHKPGASVGLAIVAALDVKPSEILSNYIVLSNPPSPRSDPVPVINNNKSRIRTEDEDEDENFTYVICRGATKNPVTRVYHDLPAVKPLMYSKVEDQTKNNNNNHECSDFLSSCDMCRKTLAGKDIFMYRGEKAFCSEECRQSQIASDERKEKLSRRASKTVVSRSPCYYETGQIFSTGIIATY